MGDDTDFVCTTCAMQLDGVGVVAINRNCMAHICKFKLCVELVSTPADADLY